MKHHFNKLNKWVAVGVLALIGFALQSTDSAMAGSYSLTMAPMNQSIIVNPGESFEASFKISNSSGSTQDTYYKIEIEPFYMSEKNEIQYEAEGDSGKIVEWTTLNIPAEGKLVPNETKEVVFTIDVPESAPAGGQYAAIIVTEKPEKEKDEGVTVNNIFEMASLIYADVEGETVHEGEILENNISGFVTGAPIMVGALVNNNGNIHESATITIEAKDFFTGAVIVGSDDVSGHYSELVMPETTRRIEREIREGLPALGVIHVEQKIDYNGKTSVEAKNVIICPIWFLVLIIAVIASLVFVIIRIVRKHRKNKSELIA